MPSTRDIRRRIRGVKNIKQVTRAMNMIAAARLRRAQGKAESARPYAERITEILQDVQAGGTGLRHPLPSLSLAGKGAALDHHDAGDRRGGHDQ